MNLVGRKDAWALAAASTGLAAASPWLAGHPLAALGLVAPALGGAWLAQSPAKKWLNRVDLSRREGFILPSDETFGDLSEARQSLRFGYTRDNGLPLDIADPFLTRHTAIIGQSGVGKTTIGEYILWQQAARGAGFLFIDAKLDAETRDKLAFMMAMLGRSDDFYVLNVDQPSNSNTYNPLLNGDPDEVASRLLNLLPSAENSPGADYFRQQANYALTVLIGVLKASKRRYHFQDLAVLLQSGAALESLTRFANDNPTVQMTTEVFLNQFKKNDKGKVSIDSEKVRTILGGMSGRIAQFAQGKMGEVFNTYAPEIDLTDIVANNKCCYVMLPTMGKDTAALNLGKMVLSDLRTAVYNIQGLPKEKRPSPPFIVFADEMGSYVMPGIARLFEQARSAGICMIPAFQSFANLRTVSPDFADIIIQNTWNKIFFKFASEDSPKTAAEIIGMQRQFAYSVSQSQNEGASANNLRASPQGSASKGGGLSESWRQEENYRVTPDQLRALGTGEAVVMSGARMFHIKTPMLNFPKRPLGINPKNTDPSLGVPEYKAVKRIIYPPPDEIPLNISKNYRAYMESSSTQNDQKDQKGQQSDAGAGVDTGVVAKPANTGSPPIQSQNARQATPSPQAGAGQAKPGTQSTNGYSNNKQAPRASTTDDL